MEEGRRGWIVGVRAALALALGALLLGWPEVALRALNVTLGAYVLLDGGASLWAGLWGRSRGARVNPLLLRGAAGIAAGCVLLLWRGIPPVWTLAVAAAWLVVTGLAQVAGALGRERGPSTAWMLAAGAVSVAAAALLAIRPQLGPTLAWTLGAYGVVYGLFTLGALFRTRVSRSRGAEGR